MGVLGGFCNTPFWDGNATWTSDLPNITKCFKQTALVWIPCGVLWLIAPWKFKKILSHQGLPRPWSWLSISKLVMNIILSLIHLCMLILVIIDASKPNSHIFIVDLLTPIIELISVLVVITINQCARNRGLTANVVLPIFWFLQSLATSISTYSSILEKYATDKEGIIIMVSEITEVILILIQTVLSGFSEPPVPERIIDIKKCPLDNSSFISRLHFWWIKDLLRQGRKQQLHLYDLLPLCTDMQSANASKSFDYIMASKGQHKESYSERSVATHENMESEISSESSILIHSSQNNSTYPKLNLFWAVLYTGGIYLLIASVLQFFSILFAFLPAYILNLFLAYIEGDEFYWHGYVYSILLPVSVLFAAFINTQLNHNIMASAIRIKSSLISAIYKKIFLLNSTSKMEHTTEKIVNYMSVDAEHIFLFSISFIQTWGIPLQILLGIIFLWIVLGLSGITGLSIIILLMMMNQLIILQIDKFKKVYVEEKDNRLKLASEILKGIKVLKLHGWEPPFIKEILKIRNKELWFLKLCNFWSTSFNLLCILTPFLAALGSFAMYTLVFNKTLDAQVAFVSLILFNILCSSFGALPHILESIVQLHSSLERLQKYFNSEELDVSSIGKSPPEGIAVSIDNANFSWDGLFENLKNIQISIKQGSLVAIIGPEGSGKSSLLSALLGEMDLLNGKVNIEGSIAYLSQNTWIQNATLQDNICFISSMDHIKYNAVLEACAITTDLANLPFADLTEIGENGVSLNNELKKKICLARAVYQDCDVYLLDDPFSFFEEDVSAHLFKTVIGPSGLLKNKTRFLVTNDTSILHEVDHIILFKNGTIAEQGTLAELLDRNESLKEFIQFHIAQENKLQVKVKDSIFAEESIESSVSMCQSALSRMICLLKNSKEELQNIKDSIQPTFSRPLAHDEPKEFGQASRKIYFKYIQDIGISVICLSIIIAGLCSASELAAGFWLSKWIIESSSNIRTIYNEPLKIGIYGSLIASQGIFVVISTTILLKGILKASWNLHKNLLSHVFRLPLRYFDASFLNYILNRFDKDMELIDSEIPMKFNYWLCVIFLIPSCFVAISLVTPYVLLVFLPLILIYYGIQRLYIGATLQLKHLYIATRPPIVSNFVDTIEGISTIRALQAQNYFIRRSNKRADINHNSFFLIKSANRWVEIFLNYLGMLVVLITGLLAVVFQDRGAGLVGLALYYSLQIAEGLNSLIKLALQIETNMLSFKRIQECFLRKQENLWENNEDELPPNWSNKGTIDISSFSTAVQDAYPALHNINISINSGEKVGILGQPDSGISSMALVIPRIIEATQGHISIDDVNIADVGLSELRSKLTIIPKELVIFPGTVRLNLDPYYVKADQEIWRILEIVQLKSLVESFPNGLEFDLSGGQDLSNPDRKLICLARALLHKTKILLMLDPITPSTVDVEYLFQKCIRENFSDCTIITIFPGLYVSLDYNRVIVLANGQVVEDGNSQTLLSDPLSRSYSYLNILEHEIKKIVT